MQDKKQEQKYKFITHDITLVIARHLVNNNPDMTFCFVSGAGSDSTEKGTVMWDRIKGKTENAIKRWPFKDTYMFRPGFIKHVNGVESKTKLD